MPPKLKFQEGEKVLCYHGPLIYEAKCMKSQAGKDKEKGAKFFIHYNGWNKNWDEWVPEQRVLKFTEANLQKQKELIQQHKKEGKEKKGKRKIEGGIGRGSRKEMEYLPRRKRGRFGTSVEALQNRTEICVSIPEELKQCLLQDWELVMQQKQLVKLPSTMPVNRIMEQYVEARANKERKGAAQEVVSAIMDYFKVLLGTQLLYQPERSQYDELLAKMGEKIFPVSSVYGAEHLLRLFVRLGSVMSYAVMDEESVSLLLSHIHDFLQYMQENIVKLFQKEYTAGPV